MKLITDNLSKEIVAAYEGETAGIVTNAYTDPKLKKIRGYKISDDNSDDVKLLPLPRVIGEGDALVIKNLFTLKSAAYPECPLGAKVYDTSGVLHGVLRDVAFDQTNGDVLSLIVDEKEVAPERIVGFGSKVVVLRAPAHDSTLFKKGGNVKRAKKAAPATLDFSIAVSPAKTEEAIPQSEQTEDRTFLFQDYAFLLGRTVLKTIESGEGVVAERNEVVTPEVIFRARESGKLVELTVNRRK